jgi:hypothetical protein
LAAARAAPPAAASLTDKPRASMISVRMKLPGWAGFFIL